MTLSSMKHGFSSFFSILLNSNTLQQSHILDIQTSIYESCNKSYRVLLLLNLIDTLHPSFAL